MKQNSRHSLALTALFCAAFAACCSALALTSTDAIPRGVRAAAFVYGFAPVVDSNFDVDGKLDYLVSPLNRSITFDELAEFEPELKRLKNVVDSFYPEKIGNQLLHADLYAQAKVFEQRYVSALLWGLTDRLSVGVLVPVMDRSIKSNFRADVVNQGEELKELFGQIPELRDVANDLKNAKLDTEVFSQKIFQANGYQTPQDFQKSGLGDVEFELRYLYFKSEALNLSLRTTLRTPTGDSESDLSNLLDRPLGSGNYSLKLGLLQDYKPFGPRWILSSAAFLTHHFVSTETKAVRREVAQLLPDLNDPYQVEKVQKMRGLDFMSDIALSRSFWDGAIWFASSYIFQAHAQDHYRGNRDLHYAELYKNTQSSEHGLEFSLEFSSIQMFLSQKFPIPAKMVFAWYEPFKGKNTIYAPYGRMDFALLF